jgi:hypothetical protein
MVVGKNQIRAQIANHYTMGRRVGKTGLCMRSKQLAGALHLSRVPEIQADRRL